MTVRGIRGATTVEENNAEEIVAVTKELLQTLIEKNNITPSDVASAIFSVTPDLTAQFPAVAARMIGWDLVPLFCTNEIPVEGALQKCIRVLLHINTDRPQEDLCHLYLRGAHVLRPDLKNPQPQYRSE